MFIRLFIVFKWVFIACVLHVKSTQQQRSLFTEKGYEIKAFHVKFEKHFHPHRFIICAKSDFSHFLLY